MTKIFISHSYQDKKFVNLLTSRLRDDGIQVWTDEKELAVGDNIEEKVTDAIKKTDYFIVVLWVLYPQQCAERIGFVGARQTVVVIFSAIRSVSAVQAFAVEGSKTCFLTHHNGGEK